MSDLERFIDLYKSFGIQCVVGQDGANYEIVLGLQSYHIDNLTESDKFFGYSGYTTTIAFDADGKFFRQSFEQD